MCLPPWWNSRLKRGAIKRGTIMNSRTQIGGDATSRVRASHDLRFAAPIRHAPKSGNRIRSAGKLARSLLLVSTAFIAWTPQSLAQRQTAVGPGIIPLNTAGGLNGVDMSASGITGTLSVGVAGGPPADIFTLNNPPAAGLVAVSTGASSQGNIVFNSSSTVYGAIGVTQPGGPFLLNIAAGNNGTVVNFNGPVYATTLNVSGTGAVNFNSASTNVTATNFAADGTISLAPNTTVIGALTTTAGANTGTLSLGNASVLNGAVGGAIGLKNIAVVGGSNTAGATASITGAVDAYAFSLGTNTLNIGGALTIANLSPSGVINTILASPTVYGNIRPVGATNLGPTLTVNVTVPSTTLLPVGTIFDIVQTQAGTVQSGTNGSVVTVVVKDPSNPLYTFSAMPPAGTVAGLVAIQTTGIPLLVPLAPPPGAVLPPTAPIAVVVVPVLVQITPPVVTPGAPPPVAPPVAPTSDIVTVVLPAINALTTPAAVVNAVAQLAPDTPSLAAPLVAFQGTREFQDLARPSFGEDLCSQTGTPDRHDGSKLEDSSYCRVNDPHRGIWLRSFGYFGDQGTQQSFEGYNSRILGVMVGFDVPLDSSTLAGLALGYAHSTLDGSTSGSRVDFDTHEAMIYFSHDSENWFVYGDGSLGLNDYWGDRHISFPGVDRTATSTYSGATYTGYANAGYRFFTQGMTITPFASLQYSRLNINGYNEAGAGDIDLNVASQSYDFLESGLGARVTHPFDSDGETYAPEIHATWFHELKNPALENTAAFAVAGSLPFTTPDLKPAGDTFNAGAGLTFLSCRCSGRIWSLEADYDFYWTSESYSAHRVMLKFTYRV